jgi:AcrR family transcriptional regulator
VTDRPQPGRPQSIDPAAVALVAGRLFERQGYEATTMDDVAAAAGVSRRSLFNHFPRKESLLWSGFEPYLDHLRARLSTADLDANLGEELPLCMAGALDDLGAEQLALARTRLRIVADNPDLVVAGARELLAAQTLLADTLGNRRRRHGLPSAGEGSEPRLDDLAGEALAAAVTAAVFTGMITWATRTTDSSPRATVLLALRALGQLQQPLDQAR